MATKVSCFYRFLIWMYYVALDLNWPRVTRLKILTAAFCGKDPDFNHYRAVARGYDRGKYGIGFILICFTIAILTAAAIVVAVR